MALEVDGVLEPQRYPVKIVLQGQKYSVKGVPEHVMDRFDGQSTVPVVDLP